MKPICSQSVLLNADNWDPNHCAVSRTSLPLGNEPGQRRIVVLRHPTYPFQRDFTAHNEDALNDRLEESALEYVERVRSVAGIPDAWVDALRNSNQGATKPTFDWLPVHWRIDPGHIPGAVRDPRYSFWAERSASAGPPSAPLVRTLVLLASYVFSDKDGVWRSLGSEQGLRIVIDVRSDGARHEARITSLSAALIVHTARQRLAQWEEIDAGISSVQLAIARALRLATVRFRGVGEDQRGLLLFGSGISTPDTGTVPQAYDFIAVVRAKPGSVEFELANVRKSLRRTLATDQVVQYLFTRDPASAGPPGTIRRRRRRREDTDLNAFRVQTTVPLLTGQPGWAGHAALLHPGLFEVRQSRFVDQAWSPPPLEPSDRESSDLFIPETIATELPFPVRANAVDAAHAYYHGCNLFGRLIAFGLHPGAYFKLAKLPLILRYRSAIAPGSGSDGQTVNAQVDFYPEDPDFRAPVQLNTRPSLTVEFALGDLKRRLRPALDHRGIFRMLPRAAYLGIGADPRWVWHEFGHVLIGASTGEVELRFAHSVGDALAAINADPTSELVADPSWRGVTYPWIGSIRRHDRDVHLGWSWCGSFHRATRASGDTVLCNRKAYVTEQILSTTLFRLYLSLGGETNRTAGGVSIPDRDARQAAADYVVYLIMRAVQLLGPVSAVPAEIVEQFVTALIDADVGAGEWKILAAWPYEQGKLPRSLSRIGGHAHKVVRWAFEAQGLYAADSVGIVNEPGEPPSVDLYLDDLRPPSQGKHPRGGYMPVSLHWDAGTGAAAPWHATEQAIGHDTAKEVIWLNVHNRGAVSALNVNVSAWIRNANNPAAPWTALVPGAALPTTVPASANGTDGVQPFGPYAFAPGAGTFLVAALVSCPGDLANSAGPNSLWADGPLLRDLIANDNNIGLREVTVL